MSRLSIQESNEWSLVLYLLLQLMFVRLLHFTTAPTLLPAAWVQQGHGKMCYIVIHWHRGKISVISQMTLWISPKISLKFVPNIRIYNIPTLFQIMAWRRPGDKPVFEPMMVSLLTHICASTSLGLNEIKPVNRLRRQHLTALWKKDFIQRSLPYIKEIRKTKNKKAECFISDV